MILAVIASALQLACLALESVPVELRRAQFLVWFSLTWPVLRFLLKLAKVPEDYLSQIDGELKAAPVDKAKASVARAQAKAATEPRFRALTFDEFEEAA